jgi:4-hydroxy-4-methyl-2-oxoglutarate aldolase
MKEFVERLSQLDSCAVSDALDRLNLSGAVLGIHALSVPKRITGQVITVKLGLADGTPSTRHLCTAAVDSARPGEIIVVANEGRLDVSGWGGILSLGAVQKGVSGVIVDGACRDLDESRELDLPVYARAAVPLTARGRVIETDWNVSVQVSGITVSPGDYVIADGSGTVFIPAINAEQIICLAEEIYKKEQTMAAAVRAGHPMAEVMGASYENLLSMGDTNDD